MDFDDPHSGDLARIAGDAAQAGYQPGVAQVRLVGPPEVIDAANALLADLCGDAWTSSTRKPGRHEGGDHLQYGTLIVPVPRGDR